MLKKITSDLDSAPSNWVRKVSEISSSRDDIFAIFYKKDNFTVQKIQVMIAAVYLNNFSYLI